MLDVALAHFVLVHAGSDERREQQPQLAFAKRRMLVTLAAQPIYARHSA
jgi:hypothetical protein